MHTKSSTSRPLRKALLQHRRHFGNEMRLITRLKLISLLNLSV